MAYNTHELNMVGEAKEALSGRHPRSLGHRAKGKGKRGSWVGTNEISSESSSRPHVLDSYSMSGTVLNPSGRTYR